MTPHNFYCRYLRPRTTKGGAGRILEQFPKIYQLNRNIWPNLHLLVFSNWFMHTSCVTAIMILHDDKVILLIIKLAIRGKAKIISGHGIIMSNKCDSCRDVV